MVTLIAAVVAAAIAVGWTVSPLTVACLVFLLTICAWAVRDLRGRERGWVIGALTIAVAARVAVLAVVFLRTDPAREQFVALIPDGRFAIQRSLMLLDLWRGDTIGPANMLIVFDPYGGHVYNRSLAIIQWFFGPSPYAIVLVSVCAFMAGAVLLFRLARPRVGRAAALIGLVLLLFWPSWFAWSVTMLKESTVLLLGTIIVWGGVRLIDRERSWLVACIAIVVGVAGLLGLRDGVVAIPAGGTLIGLGAALALRRSGMALALVGACVLLLTLAASRPAVQTFVAMQVRAAASRHIGHVNSSGYAYKIVDQRFYSGWPEAPWTMQFDEGVRFLMQAAAAFILVPLPGQLPPRIGAAFLPQQLVWYLLVALALPGFWLGLRRSPHLTLALAGCCAAGLVVVAPNSGNIGTLVRHRDMVVPFLVWLSAAGAARFAEGGRIHGMD